MSTKASVLISSVALVAVVACALLYREWRHQSGVNAKLVDRCERLEKALREAKDSSRDMHDELARVEKSASELAGLLAKQNQEATSKVEEKTENPSLEEKETPEARKEHHGPYVLESIDDAERLLAGYLSRGDLEGLWLLAADLLALGPEGYDKIIELSRGLEKNKEMQTAVGLLWKRPEVMIGPFLRSVAEHREDLLRFGLHLDTKQREELPEILKEMHEEMDDELGTIILGFYDGNDPDILDGYADKYSKQIEKEIEAGGGNVRDQVFALSQIPTSKATDTLIDLLPRSQGRNLQTVVRALAWQRSERALPTLRALLETTQDAELAAVVKAAIRYLE